VPIKFSTTRAIDPDTPSRIITLSRLARAWRGWRSRAAPDIDHFWSRPGRCARQHRQSIWFINEMLPKPGARISPVIFKCFAVDAERRSLSAPGMNLAPRGAPGIVANISEFVFDFRMREPRRRRRRRAGRRRNRSVLFVNVSQESVVCRKWVLVACVV